MTRSTRSRRSVDSPTDSGEAEGKPCAHDGAAVSATRTATDRTARIASRTLLMMTPEDGKNEDVTCDASDRHSGARPRMYHVSSGTPLAPGTSAHPAGGPSSSRRVVRQKSEQEAWNEQSSTRGGGHLVDADADRECSVRRIDRAMGTRGRGCRGIQRGDCR